MQLLKQELQENINEENKVAKNPAYYHKYDVLQARAIVGCLTNVIEKIDIYIVQEQEAIEQAYKTGYTEKEYLDYYPDKHSKEYFQHTYGQTNT